MPVTIEAFAGGAVDRGAINLPFYLKWGMPRVQTIDPNATGIVYMPDARYGRTGRFVWCIVNESATREIQLADLGGTVFGTIESAGASNTSHGWVSLIGNDDYAGKWSVALLEEF